MSEVKKKLFCITPKSKWARDMVKQYGEIVQFAAEMTNREGEKQIRFVSPKEDDTYNFKHWSYWVTKAEVDLLEI